MHMLHVSSLQNINMEGCSNIIIGQNSLVHHKLDTMCVHRHGYLCRKTRLVNDCTFKIPLFFPYIGTIHNRYKCY